MVLCWWESDTRKFGIKKVDKVQTSTAKRLKPWSMPFPFLFLTTPILCTVAHYGEKNLCWLAGSRSRLKPSELKCFYISFINACFAEDWISLVQSSVSRFSIGQTANHDQISYLRLQNPNQCTQEKNPWKRVDYLGHRKGMSQRLRREKMSG